MGKIRKRDTFKEAFADVLKLSHDQLLNHPVDPFIGEAFETFLQMDLFHKNNDIEFHYDIRSNYVLLCKEVNVYSRLSKNEYTYSDMCFGKNFAVTENIFIFFPHAKSGNGNVASSCTESSEVQQWLLAA